MDLFAALIQFEAKSFTTRLLSALSPANANQNFVISPLSIKTSLAMLYLGANGKTASELRRHLHLGDKSVSKEQVAERFGNLLTKLRNNDKAKVKMSNRIYAQSIYHILPEFNHMALRYFDSGAENVDFADGEATARKINSWLERQTDHKMRSYITSNRFEYVTDAILFDISYFSGRWLNSFCRGTTAEHDFHLSRTSKKTVDMMHQKDIFGYAELENLNAKALSMSFIGTDIEMLVLLPHQLDGLALLEQKLNGMDLTKLLYKLKEKEVRVSFPRFRIECDISLKSTLKTLGMHNMFSLRADFSEIFAIQNQVAMSDVVHKTYIEVNERGINSIAGVAMKMTLLSKPKHKNIRDFHVDHPFYFALLDNEAVYFAGHVVDI